MAHWHGTLEEWEGLLLERARRCAYPNLPAQVERGIWQSMAEWVALEFFVGRNTPMNQYAYWLANKQRKGMYGSGTPDSGQPDKIINAWEILGGGDFVKGLIQKHPQNAKVLAKAGAPFLGSMFGIGPVVNIGRGGMTIGAHTMATMTPYDPTAGGTRPIMYYLKRGWTGARAKMRPRWPDGLAGWLKKARPYQPHMRGISEYIMYGS